MSRSRRSRRSRRGQPRPTAAPATDSPPAAATEREEHAAAAASPIPRRRPGRASYPHIGGELRRVLGVSLASFGLLLLLIVVDRMQ